MKRHSFPMLALAVLAAGCASPDSRIKDNPSAYAALPPAQQALVKQGHIGLGMSPEAVRLALGKPDHVTQHTDAAGMEEIWHYTIQVGGGAEFVDPWFGGPFWFPPPLIVDQPPQERDKTRVVFHNGRVASIEREL